MSDTHDSAPNSTPSSVHPFAIANYRYFWTARLFAMFSLNAMMLIVGWQAYNLARDSGSSIEQAAFVLGIIGLVQFLPLFVLTPIVGWVADRADRRWIARIVLSGQALVALILALMTYFDAISIISIYAVSALLGIARAFLGPAMTSLAPNLVPADSLPRAIALSTIAWQVGVIAGPAMAGPLYAISPSFPYFICVALFGVATLAMFLISPVPRSMMNRTHGPLKQLVDGLAYVGTNKLVLGAITLDLMVMFLAGAQAMIPVFARDILGSDELALSLLAPAPAIGAVLTGALLSIYPLKKNVGLVMLASMMIFGIGTIGFGLSTWLPLSIICLAACGAADMFGVFVRSSLIQLHTPDEKRGRVNAVSQMTISASNELGDAFTGSLAFIIGPVAAIVGGGAGAIAVTAFWSRLFPQLAAAKTFDQPDHLLKAEPKHSNIENDKTAPDAK
ncbi:MFS transporter [Parasphingorhabdus sp. DH2-15]|uniref:MFS transporter n=1 Tax=Parasphingorhabdus sp. DH2-15 TaxID=3444112 RepID=UPI003F6830D4